MGKIKHKIRFYFLNHLISKTGSFPVPPPFKIPSFMFVLRVITAKCVMLRCKVWRAIPVHSWWFVHHAKFHCIMTRLNKLFKVEFERGEPEKSPKTVLDDIYLKFQLIFYIVFFFPSYMIHVMVSSRLLLQEALLNNFLWISKKPLNVLNQFNFHLPSALVFLQKQIFGLFSSFPPPS